MSEAVANGSGGKVRKVALQLVLGAICGGVGMFAALWLFEGQSGSKVDPARVLAIGTALVFGLMAFFVGLGALAPSLGARTLNVEDEDELTEQKTNLLVGAVTFFLIAALLTGLALGGSAGAAGTLLGPQEAALVAGAATLALAVWSFVHREKGDEMMRAAAKDAGSITTYLVVLVFGIWAAAAHLEFVAMFEPLVFVAGVFALYLLAVFIAVGKRGLLMPR
jgi:phosphoglycerol transferase MdoB-like AlkP superfamily enzyme